MPVLPLKAVLDIEPYKGGDSTLAGVAAPVKLSSNENPFGCSPKAKAAAIAALEKNAAYPEGRATLLREAIAERYGLDPDRIVCGAGSDEIFQLLLRAYVAPGDEIVQSQYAFLMYRIFGKAAGAVVRTAKNEAMRASVDGLLEEVSERTRIVFLDNPNNPTGTYLPFSEVRRLHAGLPGHVLLVIDAAYAEYVNRNDYSSGVELVSEFDNVVMTRTFSKIHGLAAMRVGWMYGPPAVAEALHKLRLPFNVSTAGQAAAAASLADMGFVEASARHNETEREGLTAAIASLGYDVTESAANFLLVHFPGEQDRDARAADAHFRKRGYIVRALGGYGLPDALRISIGAVEQNAGALSVLREFASR